MDQVRQLHDACAEGNMAAVVALLDDELCVDATDDDDITALQVAAANGQEHIVRLLLEHGATVDKTNTAGWTPLLHAVCHGHSSIAALLLQNGANINARTCFGANVQTLAARSGNLKTFNLVDDSRVSFGKDESQCCAAGIMCELTPLMVAAHRGHDTIVRHLLNSGLVNFKMPSLGVTAVMAAAIGGHISTTKVLVEPSGGADPNTRDINDRCALDIAVLLGKSQLQEYLESKTVRRHSLSCGLSEPAIIEAVKQGDIELVRAILEQDISQRDASTTHDDGTPLMFGAMLGHLDIVQLLVESGCNINRQDAISGWTALMQATFHGKKSVAKYLISAGADVTIIAKTGCTAFDMATLIEDIDAEMYRLLVAAHTMQNSSTPDPPLKKLNRLSAVKPDLVQTTEPTDSTNSTDLQQKTGIKAWWSRISNRFHNLKPEKVSSLKLNEALAPRESHDVTLTGAGTDSTRSSSRRNTHSLSDNSSSSVNEIDTSVTKNRFDVATTKNALIFSLGPASVLPQGSGGRTLKPVVPPFFPPPSFQADRNMRMPPIGLRKPISGVGSTQTLMLSHSINSNAKLLQSAHSTLNLVNRVASPPPRVQFANRPTKAVKLALSLDVSPSASCNAATLDSSNGAGSCSSARGGPRSKVLSSASSSTLTTGSDKTDKILLCNGSLHNKRDHHSKSQKSGDIYQLRSRRRDSARDTFAASHSSKDSASTLTPVQSPKHHSASHQTGRPAVTGITWDSNQDDLDSILQKLSLERYQPIFEEQEVDMEAFLTLTSADLVELGISSSESRHQILKAIGELNNSKDRERQHYQQVMATYADSMRSQIASGDDCKVLSGGDWTDRGSVVN